MNFRLVDTCARSLNPAAESRSAGGNDPGLLMFKPTPSMNPSRIGKVPTSRRKFDAITEFTLREGIPITLRNWLQLNYWRDATLLSGPLLAFQLRNDLAEESYS